MNMIGDSPAELEKWMRRIEIGRLWEPDKKSLSIEQMGRLSQAFMNYAMTQCDYRFLNAALKLNDRLRQELKDSTELTQIEDKERENLTTLEKRLGLA